MSEKVKGHERPRKKDRVKSYERKAKKKEKTTKKKTKTTYKKYAENKKVKQAEDSRVARLTPQGQAARRAKREADYQADEL